MAELVWLNGAILVLGVLVLRRARTTPNDDPHRRS